MRRLVTLLAFAALSAVTFGGTPAQAEYPWRHYNVDPFAASRDEAMAARPRVFREAFRFSEACVQAAYAAMRVSGRAGRLNNGDRLEVMMSKGFIAHRDVLVDLVRVDRGIDPSPVTEEWEFDCDGAHRKIALPEHCNNWVLYPVSGAPGRQALVPVSNAVGACPNGYSITVHVWSIGTLPEPLRSEALRLVGAAQDRDLSYQGPAFSRTLGKRLRTTPGVRHAPANVAVQVNALDPGTRRQVQSLGVIQVFVGTGVIRLPVDPRHYIIELIFPDEFVSPVPSNGVRRLLDLPTEWPECVQNMHAAIP